MIIPRPRLLAIWCAGLLLGLGLIVSAVQFRRMQGGGPVISFELAWSSGDARALPVALLAASRAPAIEGAQAFAANASLPVLLGGLETSRPFAAGFASPQDRLKAETCLAQAMYYEAGFEGREGREAVAQVVLNRVRHPAFPHTVCGVVYQQQGGVCQFTFACDGALARSPVPGLWQQVKAEARATLAGQVLGAVGMATHYHADYVYPAWAPRLDKIAVIGHHIFYRWPQGWGRWRAFTSRYTGLEPAGPQLPGDPALGPGQQAMALGDDASAPPVYRSEHDGGYLDPFIGWKPQFLDTAAHAPAGTPPTGANLR